METYEIFIQLNEIFRDIFDEESLVITPHTTAIDVEGWDSLNHIQLIVEIEKKFKIKFSSKEIFSWKNVGDLAQSIQTKVSS